MNAIEPTHVEVVNSTQSRLKNLFANRTVRIVALVATTAAAAACIARSELFASSSDEMSTDVPA